MARHSVALLSLALTALAACGDTPGVSAPTTTAASASPALAVATSRSATAAEGRYIVAFRAGFAPGHARILEKLGRTGGRLTHTYTHVLSGFAAELSPAAAAVLRVDPEIATVVPDPVITVSATQSNPVWGLDRIDQAALPLTASYTYANNGSGVTVYILDTGINTAHVDFGGRAVPGYDAITPGGTAGDCHGHGTHVAGTVGGTTYGVAKGARLVAVRVLDCTGNGTGSGLLAGLDWIAQQKAASPSTPMIMNMSLGGSASQVLDDAVQNVINKGVSAAVAAGNASVDACTASPARLPDAITVGATDASDNFASFSNRGACVDLSAPGVSIYSAYYSSTTGVAGMSGTSMATPHVAGAAALFLNANPAATPAQVTAALTGNAVSGAIKLLPTGTVNKLLNVGFLAAPSVPASTIALSPKSSSLTIGGTAALAATVGNPVAGGTVTWVSRNPAVASVASTGATTATATAVAAGSAYIVSTYTAGTTTVRDSALVTVAAPTVTMSPRTASILVGASTTLSAAVANGGTGGATSWTSRSTAVATVGTTGTVTGVAAGSAYVVATYTVGGTAVRDSALVTVTAPAPAPPPPTSPATVAFASATGKGCITSPPVTSWGVATVVPCVAGQADQLWTAPAAGTQGVITIFAGKRCLTGFNNGVPVNNIGSYACMSGWVTQQWTHVAATSELRIATGYCATALTNASTNVTTVVVKVCDGSASQRWTRQ